MNSSAPPEFIVFDNLVRPTEVVGEFTKVKAKTPPIISEPFVNTNAAGSMRQINSFEDIQRCAYQSGERLKAMFSA